MSEIVDFDMLDGRIQEMLSAYGATPERDSETAHRTRTEFLLELDRYFAEPTIPRSTVRGLALAIWITNLARLKDSLIPFLGKRAVAYAFMALVIFGIFLFGGVGMTVHAAALSLPGDAIYPLKMTLENARIGLAENPEARASLALEFAARRLAEMYELIDAGRYADIAQAAHEFENEIQMAFSLVESLSQTDPARAVDLNVKIAATLRGYRHILAQMLGRVPVDVQPFIQTALKAASSATTHTDDESISSPGNDDGDGTATPMPDLSMTSESTTSTPTTSPTPSPTMPADLPTIMPTSPPPTNAPSPPPTNAPVTRSTDTPEVPPGSSVVEGADAMCTGFIGAVMVNNLEVPPGATCTLNGTTVLGNISLKNGATLLAQRVIVNGNIQGEGAAYIEVLAGSSVGGSIQLKQGGSARVEGVSVNGDIQFQSNQGTLSAAFNSVGGNIQVFQNNGSILVSDNSVNGNLQCKENSPVPAGGNNVVQGTKEDQCAGL